RNVTGVQTCALPIFQQLIKLEIRDLRIVQNIVTVLVIADLFTQLFDFPFDVLVHSTSSATESCLKLYRLPVSSLRLPLAGSRSKIGRASCREGVLR